MDKQKTLRTRIIVFSAIFVTALVISLIFISARKADGRYVFLFESLDDADVHVEVRYINTVPDGDEITCYLNDLLLGPSTNRYRPLFASGTTLRSCFLRNGTLFIDLSGEAMLQAGASSETERACSLLKENITSNFSRVDDIQIFILGNEVYREENTLIVGGE